MNTRAKLTAKGSGILDIDFKKRIVAGNATFFDTVSDEGFGSFKVAQDAFNDSIAMYGPKNKEFIKTFYNHGDVIGQPLLFEIRGNALWTVNYIGKSLLADDVLMLVEDGIIDAMSVSFWPERKAREPRTGHIVYTKATLYDVSLVSWPVCPDTKPLHLGEKVMKAYRQGKYRHPMTWDNLKVLVDYFEGQEDRDREYRKMAADIQRKMKMLNP